MLPAPPISQGGCRGTVATGIAMESPYGEPKVKSHTRCSLFVERDTERTLSTWAAAFSWTDSPLLGPSHRLPTPLQMLPSPKVSACSGPGSPAAPRFSRENGHLAFSVGSPPVPELFYVFFVSSQKLLFSLQPVLELGDLIEHQIEVPLSEPVDSLSLFCGEVLHGYVPGHVLDVHQTPERFAHVHVLQGKRLAVRGLAQGCWWLLQGSQHLILGRSFSTIAENTAKLGSEGRWAFSRTFIYSTSLYAVPF